MKHLAVALLLALVVCVVCEEKYTSEFDNFNYKEVIGNERLSQNYCKCILGKGSCTREGKKLLEHIPDAIETRCSKCTDKQKIAVKDVLNHLRSHKPQECYYPLLDKFDSEKKHRDDLEKYLTS